MRRKWGEANEPKDFICSERVFRKRCFLRRPKILSRHKSRNHVKPTSRNRCDNTVYCLFDSTCSWDCSSTKHTANTFRGTESPPPSWCIDHKSVACTNRNWWLMWNLLKLLSEIYDGVQVATKHSLVAFGCSSAAEWLATDWFALTRRCHRQCQQCSPDGCCLNCCSSRSRLSFAAAVGLLYISFQWELKQVEKRVSE